MKTLAITNIRGGATKTTQAAHLGIAAAKAGRRVLLVDLDPQAHLTVSLARAAEPTIFIDSLLVDWYRFGSIKPETVKAAVLETPVKGLCIIPSRLDLNAVPTAVAAHGNPVALAKILEAVAEDFDFVILDTPATFGYLHTLAFVAANSYAVVLSPDTFSLQGLWDSQKEVDALKALLRIENPAFIGWMMARVPESEIQDAKKKGVPPSARRVALREIRQSMDADWTARIAEIPMSSAFENARALMTATMTVFDLPRTAHLQELYATAWKQIEHRIKKG